MREFTQAHRPMRVETELGTDVLLLDAFTGVERISQPFSFRLDLLSRDRDIDPESLLRRPVTLSIDLENRETRYLHGFVNRFAQGDQVQTGEGAYLTSYTAEVVPWLWFLSLSRDCRIFQKRTVLEIVEEVFRDLGWNDFAIRCVHDYPKRDFRVQYRETHLNFVSRLLEEEGIFYFFQHTDSSHTLVLADHNGAITACPHKEEALVRSEPLHGEDVVTGLRSEYGVHAGKVTLKDYDYLHPTGNLEIEIPGIEEQEIYDYHPGRFTRLAEGERYARLQLEALEAERHLVHGEGTCRAFQAGSWFHPKQHFSPRLNQRYTLVEVSHTARGGGYRTGGVDTGYEYHNRFSAIPHDVPYRPPHRHRKPVLQGSQTAVVVGRAGEEIWTDRYGRVKVQFHWDRKGSRNENSSCWVRVATPWGSKGFGSVSIPRIGDEVVVDFLEGDPDRPVIVGSVYNAERMPPFEFPAQQTQAGIRSHSIKGGSGNFSEIRFEDKPGEEKLVIRAERDHHVIVQHNEYHTVEGTAVFDYGGVKIKAGNLAAGGGQKEVDYTKYGGYDANYGAIYRAKADRYEGTYGSANLNYGASGSYRATYHGPYSAYYHEPYSASYNDSYRATYFSPSSSLYAAHFSLAGSYLAAYTLYGAYYGVYISLASFYAPTSLVYMPSYAVKVEKGKAKIGTFAFASF